MKQTQAMTAAQLIDEIKDLCRLHYIKPEEITINYRHDYDSDIWCVRDVRLATDGAAAQVTRHIDGKGGITGRQLIDRLKRQCRTRNLEPEKVRAEFLYGSGSSYPITEVWEDSYDAETNSVLESIVLVTEPEDQ